MKAKRPDSGSIKKAGNNIITANRDTKVVLVKDTVSTPGNGLWCINTDKPRNIKSRDTNNTNNINNINNLNTNPNQDLEYSIDKKIIETLKFQIQDLTSKLATQYAKQADAEYRLERAEHNQEIYSKIADTRAEESKEMETKIDTLENTVINLNEALSNARREIVRLQGETNQDQQKSKNYMDLYQKVVVEKERIQSNFTDEINELKSRINNLKQDNQNLVNMLEIQDRQQMIEQKTLKNLDEKENQIKSSEMQLKNLINENADVKRRLVSEETNKTNLNLIIKKKKVKIEALKTELKSYKDAINNYNNEAKWKEELVQQRDMQIKVFKEKIKRSDEDIVKLKKEIDKISKKSNKENNTINQVEEDIVKVKGKPFLFGPESDE